MATSGWEHYEHGADIGVRGWGSTPAAAFEQTALALTAVVADLDRVNGETAVAIHCHAPDRELLLVDWLNALISEMATRGLLFNRFEVNLEGNVLQATAWGEAADPARHATAVEAKGATYTTLAITHSEDGLWVAQTVVDV